MSTEPAAAHTDSSGRRGFLNEVAFHLAHLRTTNVDSTINEATEIARSNIGRLDQAGNSDLGDPSPAEVSIISAIEHSLMHFVERQASGEKQIIFEPTFKGCGFLEASVGDLIVGDALFEVKAGDRLFRSTDLRQLITYCAMNFANKSYQIYRAGCVNPRRGTYFVLDLETLALQLSGKSATELFNDIIYYLSSSGISR